MNRVPERYVADENFPSAIVRLLRQRGHTVMHVAGSMASASDEAILQAALDSDSILLPFDRDFGELVFRRRLPTAGIVLFRLRQQPPPVTIPFLRGFFESQPILRGFFTVASPGQFRQRPLGRASREPS